MKICSAEGCGREPHCKGFCSRCYKRAWRRAHPGSVRAASKAHYVRHREQIKKRVRAYEVANRATVNQTKRRWRTKNAERVNLSARLWRAANRDHVRELARKHAKASRIKNPSGKSSTWRTANRLRVRAAERRRRETVSIPYVRHLLCARGDVPRVLLEAKRLQIMILRRTTHPRGKQ